MPADLLAILDTLRLQLISVSVAAPYYRPRLLRITQQLEYVVQTWPPEDWPIKRNPGSLSSDRQLQGMVPTQQQFLWQVAQLQTCVQEEVQLVGGYAWHQQLLDLILCLL